MRKRKRYFFSGIGQDDFQKIEMQAMGLEVHAEASYVRESSCSGSRSASSTQYLGVHGTLAVCSSAYKTLVQTIASILLELFETQKLSYPHEVKHA